MEVNVPGFNNMNIALPERAKGKNAVVLSQNGGSNYNDPHFLSDDFLKDPPRLFITAEDKEFDNQTISDWQAEGFLVEYIPMGNGGEKYVEKLERAGKKRLGPCESYGIVAYGEAASFLLEHYHVHANNDLKLRLLIAYYPSRIPDPLGKFPSNIQALVHLAGSEVGLVKHSQMVGIQGKRRVVKRTLDPGIGAGKINKLAYQSYTYNADPGFAEQDIDDYDKISADLAWTRSLAAARKAFNRPHTSIELLVDEHHQGKFHTRNTQSVLSSYTVHKTPSATYFPTLTGGVGPDDLQRFYNDYFIYANPPSLNLTLISRTVGVDRVVDEMHVTFKHTHEIPWMLPGVPPTGKRVEVMVVSIVNVRAGKLYSEHVYWDQASVFFQIGLLDPALLPKKARKLGAEELPVVGRDAARRVLRGMGDVEEGQADNELIPGWYPDTESEDDESEEEDDDESEEEEEEEEDAEDAEDDEDGEEAAGSDRPNGKRKMAPPANGKVLGEVSERRSRSKGPTTTTSTK